LRLHYYAAPIGTDVPVSPSSSGVVARQYAAMSEPMTDCSAVRAQQ
jgi:hypothetical protein